MTITWRQTGLGIFYPTVNGVDVSRDLIKKHGCTFTEADHSYLETKEEAMIWASERGYNSEFAASTAAAYNNSSASLDINDI